MPSEYIRQRNSCHRSVLWFAIKYGNSSFLSYMYYAKHSPESVEWLLDSIQLMGSIEVTLQLITETGIIQFQPGFSDAPHLGLSIILHLGLMCFNPLSIYFFPLDFNLANRHDQYQFIPFLWADQAFGRVSIYVQFTLI